MTWSLSTLGYEYPFPPGDYSETALGQLWASSKVVANICENKTQEIASLLGTAFVARGLIQVVDALGEDGLLRYWGFSYGTLLGATVAAMFPIGWTSFFLMVLSMDTIITIERAFGLILVSDVDQLSSADATFSAILSECIKAGERCALSRVNSTAEELEASLWNLANELRFSPITIGTTIVDYSFIVNLYYLAIKNASIFYIVATLILDILTEKYIESAVRFYELVTSESTPGYPEALHGIKGGETIPRYSDLAGVMPDIEYMAQASPIKTRNPILFVGNTWDPTTPASSARNMSASFEGSVMFEQHGFGHTTLEQTSACTSNIINEYFLNGKLPAPDTLCEVDTSLFPGNDA
ncbi:nedd8-like protein [Seiridium cupressi]